MLCRYNRDEVVVRRRSTRHGVGRRHVGRSTTHRGSKQGRDARARRGVGAVLKLLRLGKHGNRELQPLCPIVCARAPTMNATEKATPDTAAEVLLQRLILPCSRPAIYFYLFIFFGPMQNQTARYVHGCVHFVVCLFCLFVCFVLLCFVFRLGFTFLFYRPCMT